MSLGRNLLVGLANSAWSALIALAMVPFYLKYLGVEAYGLIGFFLTTQALFQLLDMGMAPTINREVARCSAAGDLSAAGNLLHSLAVVYWVVGVVIAVFMFVCSTFIASYWLQSKGLSAEAIAQSVILMGIVVACRWPIGVYQGALIGAQQLAVSSFINMSLVTLGSLGCVIVVAFVSPTIQAFFIWQACVGLVHAVIIRFHAWRIIGRSKKGDFNFLKIQKIWRFTAGVSVISLMGVVFTQLDKLLLSKLISLEDFSHYILASLVSGALYLIIAPVYNVVFSMFSAMAVTASAAEIKGSLRLYTRALSLVLLPVAMMIAVFSTELIDVWTGNNELANAVGPIASLLVTGAALNGLMAVPHALQIALGMIRVPLIVNGVLMVVIVPLIVFLSLRYGAIGGAFAWLIFNVFYMILSAWLMHRKILKGGAAGWLIKDILAPVLLVGMVGICTYLFYQQLYVANCLKLALAALQVVGMCAVGILLSPRVSAFVRGSILEGRLSVGKN